MNLKRFKRWLGWLFAGVLILVAVLFIFRVRVERAVFAYEIRQAHIFTGPTPKSVRANARFYWDIAGVRIARDKRVAELGPELKSLLKEINRHQDKGESMDYSMHIYREVRWRLNFTSDMQATRTRIEDLQQSLTQPELQKQARQQQASDGSWALGINVWYLQLYYTVEEAGDDWKGKTPQYPLSFLDRVNSPEKLKAELDADLHNDFTRTGVFNREELDETFSAMARMLLKSEGPPYAFDPKLAEALRDFVKRWQNPVSGCWGQWLVDRDGRIWKMDDVGMTFHVVSDLNGQVEHLDLIAKRLLQLDALDFPAGIRMNGHYENHLNWDVVKIFRAAWPAMDEATRAEARAEISRMLNWCLANSYQPDGSFKTSDMDETLSDACAYGDRFLRDAGFYDRKRRFWTEQDFPEAEAIHEKIKTKLAGLGVGE